MPLKWKRLLMISPLLSIGSAPINAAVEASSSNSAWPQYAIGQRLGSCLVRGCMVFVGTIEVVGKSQPEPGVEAIKAMTLTAIDLRITDWLYGKPEQAPEEIKIVKAEQPSFTKTALGPWTIWQGIAVKPKGQLLVAKWGPAAQRAKWVGGSEDLALVLPDVDLFPQIRQIVSENARLVSMPDEIRQKAHLLTQYASSMFAGYLVTYLMEREIVVDPNRAAIILSEIMTDKHIPSSQWREISDWIVSKFYRLSDSTRQTVSGKMYSLASSAEPNVYEVGISAILKLSDMHIRGPLNTSQKRRLLANYRTLVAQGKVRSGLESQLVSRDARTVPGSK